MKRKTRLILIYIGIITFLLSVQAIFLDHWYEKTDIGKEALTISQVVARAIDVGQYEEIARTKEHNAYFYQMQDYLINKKEDIVGIVRHRY